jgi:NAD(P)-dependent dehydrogenase (short-subunit alcohol dehydrogenase family)
MQHNQSDSRKKHTLIIGGTRGIGRTVVKTMVGEGHIVSVIGRRPPAEQDRCLPNVRHWIVDLLDRGYLLEALCEIVDQRGKLSNLVFLQRYRGEGDNWTGEIETSLTTTKDIIEQLADEFDDSSGKSVVIVSSVAGHFIAGEQPVSYHIAKAGLNQIVRFYAVALGPKGIRVNCVSCGTVLKEESKDFYLQKNRRLYELYKSITPLSRMGTSEEIAHVISFLCSSKASFITGQNIVVDGGLSLQWHESLARQLTSLNNLPVSRQTSDRLR